MTQFIAEMVIFLPPLLFALTIHEFAHGWVAYKLGDPTAKLMGRLTFNPLKHIDPVGFLMFLIIKIGWAKPVPVNPLNFKEPKTDLLKVAASGPVSNFLTAIVAGIFFRFLHPIPLPSFIEPLMGMLFYLILLSLILGFFNLIPIPPLDGWRVLTGLIPGRGELVKFEMYGPILLIILLLLPSLLGWSPLYYYIKITVGISTRLILGSDLSIYF
jgi:Zn-dependent protease